MAKRESKLSKVPVDMTPMIDVVFQLLTFFMLTLKTVIVEGDFNIKMPIGTSSGDPPLIPPIIVKMSATPDGSLSDVRFGAKGVGGRELFDSIAAADAMLTNAMAAAAQGDKSQLGPARRAKEQASSQLTAAIQQEILGAIGDDLSRAESAELELDCDPALKYDYVVSAITAASGIVQGDEVIPLIKKIKFSPPKKAK
jgi:biopolymer transport protein ExbD